MATINIGRVAGSRIFSGEAANTAAISAEVPYALNGDLYLNKLTGNLFELEKSEGEQTGTWGFRFTVKGERGPQGYSTVLQQTGTSTLEPMSQSACTQSFELKKELLFDGDIELTPSTNEISMNISTTFSHLILDFAHLSGDRQRGTAMIVNSHNQDSVYLVGYRVPSNPEYVSAQINIKSNLLTIKSLNYNKFTVATSPISVSFARLLKVWGVRP